jgi:hypothetical protein
VERFALWQCLPTRPGRRPGRFGRASESPVVRVHVRDRYLAPVRGGSGFTPHSGVGSVSESKFEGRRLGRLSFRTWGVYSCSVNFASYFQDTRSLHALALEVRVPLSPSSRRSRRRAASRLTSRRSRVPRPSPFRTAALRRRSNARQAQKFSANFRTAGRPNFGCASHPPAEARAPAGPKGRPSARLQPSPTQGPLSGASRAAVRHLSHLSPRPPSVTFTFLQF